MTYDSPRWIISVRSLWSFLRNWMVKIPSSRKTRSTPGAWGQYAYAKSWQSYLKRYWKESVWFVLPDHLGIWGENMFAIHSIVYERLNSYFYVYAMIDMEKNEILSWDATLAHCEQLSLHSVPEMRRGQIQRLPLPEISALGSTCEGYVFRSADAFALPDFSLNVAKLVRKDHVQTDETWTRNWIKATIIKV